MKPRSSLSVGLIALSSLLSIPSVLPAQGEGDRAPPRPDAVIDLGTREGVDLLKGAWKYQDAQILEVDHRYPGADLKPTGAPNRTHDISPKAGASDFDDSKWEVIDPGTIGARRSTGRLCFGWFRTQITIPGRVGSLETSGSTAILELVVDDYAEVWVDGSLPITLGQTGGHLVKGWNAPNRVTLTRDAKPGQTIQVAVFAANGPLSDPPANYVWLRSATLDLYKPGRLPTSEPAKSEVVRIDPAIDSILPPGSQLEKLAGGFAFIEGPAWHPDGFLLFSDPNLNVIYRWTQDGQVSIYRTKSGYAGVDIGEYHQPGSNGLSFDREGRVVMCEHGRRRISRLEKNGLVTVLADRYEGKRLDSPNDLVHRSDGALFFTDPPFGLPKGYSDPRKELELSGVFCLLDGKLKLVSTDLLGPNGLALSPDERFLYVTNWDEQKKIVMRYDCAKDGSLSNGRVFFDMTGAPGEEALDGIKVDRQGHLYVSGPGGLWILGADGKHLGTLRGPELAANLAWGGADGRTLYLTARTGLYRIRVGVEGAGSAVAMR